MSKRSELSLRPLSSLAKVFPQKIYGNKSAAFEGAVGQEISFQVAYRLNSKNTPGKKYRVEAVSPIKDISVFSVGLVPSHNPTTPGFVDGNYITSAPGLFPDPLVPFVTKKDSANAREFWNALWFSVKTDELTPGDYPVTVLFFDSNGEKAGGVRVKITVHNVTLAPQSFLFTQWFHCDCIASVHRVPVFSEAHWALIDKYMALAAAHGMNMILTPVLTPPLDTAVGGERPTVQLVKITRTADRYSFDFSLLERFIRLSQKNGINTFEISHFFTQWGAAHAPKVIALKDGRKKRIFGWETDAAGEEYANFLRELVPALIAFCKGLGLSERQLYFHVSDEPNIKHLPAYRAAGEILLPLIGNCPHIDALSDLDFYREGLVDVPVVATDAIEPYIKAKVSPLWCYYCCCQTTGVANRFFSMPSPRNRIIGVQFYLYGISGFLHWGYNFYYTQYSRALIDPYAVTDAGGAFPSGDAFSVYPYGDGVIPSLRQKVFAEALCDLRLLNRLEERIGRDAVVKGIRKCAGTDITFSNYPTDYGFFDRLYRFIFDSI